MWRSCTRSFSPAVGGCFRQSSRLLATTLVWCSFRCVNKTIILVIIERTCLKRCLQPRRIRFWTLPAICEMCLLRDARFWWKAKIIKEQRESSTRYFVCEGDLQGKKCWYRIPAWIIIVGNFHSPDWKCIPVMHVFLIRYFELWVSLRYRQCLVLRRLCERHPFVAYFYFKIQSVTWHTLPLLTSWEPCHHFSFLSNTRDVQQWTTSVSTF